MRENNTNLRDDRELLRRYAAEHSQEAFAHLTTSYLPLVYSLALRELRDTGLAEDATQVVFLLLARKASSLWRGRTGSIVGWLFQSARLVCQNLRRKQARQTHYETRAATEPQSVPAADTGEAEPYLLDALDALRPEERTAILLRFFEDAEYGEIGRQLGISEDAARMRVNRALVRLRAFLVTKGVGSGGDALPVLLSLLLARELLTRPSPACAETILQTPLLSGKEGTNIEQIYQGVIQTMRLRTLRFAVFAGAALVGVSLLTGVIRASAYQNSAAPIPQAKPETVPVQRTVLVKIRVLEKITGEDKKVTENVLQSPIFLTTNDQEGKIMVSTGDDDKDGKIQWSVAVLPHLNDNGTIRLKITWRQDEEELNGKDEETKKSHLLETKRTVKSGQPIRISLLKGDRSETLLEITSAEYKQSAGTTP